MSKPCSHAFDTLAVHAGQPQDPSTGAVTFPIFQTSTYAQSAPGVTQGFCYSRTENPTRRALEDCLAALEGAQHGAAFASGLAAVQAVLMTVLEAGAHVVAGRDMYAGVYRQLNVIMAKFGVTTTYVDATDPAAVAAAMTSQTKLLWLETPSNPLVRVVDIAAAVKAARSVQPKVCVAVDNTFATPCLQRPLDLGADVVVHSVTKYLSGHGDIIGGAALTNDAAMAESFGYMQNTLGGVPGPQDCFLSLRGLKTLSLRMERHCHNAKRVAEFLQQHPKVSRVYYPGLPSHPDYEVAKAQMRDFGGMVTFELRASTDEAKGFASRTKLFALAESLGAAQSLLCHPPTMTHASVEPEVRRARGVSDGLIRLSVGLEDADDLVADLQQALADVTVLPDLPGSSATACGELGAADAAVSSGEAAA